MRIDSEMINRAAVAMHAFYGIKAKPSPRDLKMMTFVLLAAIQEAHPKNEAELEDALEYNHRNNQ